MEKLPTGILDANVKVGVGRWLELAVIENAPGFKPAVCVESVDEVTNVIESRVFELVDLSLQSGEVGHVVVRDIASGEANEGAVSNAAMSKGNRHGDQRKKTMRAGVGCCS